MRIASRTYDAADVAGKKEVRGMELNVAGAAEESGVCVAVEMSFFTTQLTEFHHSLMCMAVLKRGDDVLFI